MIKYKMLLYNSSVMPLTTHFGFVSYKEPWIHFPRLTDEYMLYFIKSGELYMEEAGKRYVLKKGDCFVLQPGLIHTGFKAACCDYYYFHFKHSDITAIDKPLEELIPELNKNKDKSLTQSFMQDSKIHNTKCYLPKHYSVSNNKLLTYLLYMLKETVDEYSRKDEYYNCLTSCKLAELIIRISSEFADLNFGKSVSSYPKSFVKCQALLDYLNNEYHKKIDSHDIQERFESNYAYLNRVFKKLTGHTIRDYLNMVRIKKAIELIENTDMNFSEIGYLVGIEDPYYFSKIFKKYTGFSPKHYNSNKSKNTLL